MPVEDANPPDRVKLREAFEATKAELKVAMADDNANRDSGTVILNRSHHPSFGIGSVGRQAATPLAKERYGKAAFDLVAAFPDEGEDSTVARAARWYIGQRLLVADSDEAQELLAVREALG